VDPCGANLLDGDSPQSRPRRLVVQKTIRHRREGTPPLIRVPVRNTSFTKMSRHGKERVS
jgi:hypothetical protein